MNLQIMAKRVPLKHAEDTGGFHVVIPGLPEGVEVQILDGFIDPEYKTGHVDLVLMGFDLDQDDTEDTDPV